MNLLPITESLTVLVDETISTAMRKLELNKKQILLVIDPSGVLSGVVTDGDIRRGIVINGLGLDAPVIEVANVNPVKAADTLSNVDIKKLFVRGVDCIPRVDANGRLNGLFIQSEVGFSIGGVAITPESASFIIAEIGNNHNGDIELAKRLVDLAKESGADCAKFQMRDMLSLYAKGAGVADDDDLGAQYTMDLLSKYQLAGEQLLEIFDYCKTVGLPPLCTPWDHASVDLLENYGMTAYKVASADLTNTPLLERLAETNRPLICSTGMSSDNEIAAATKLLKQKAADFALLHCNSTYPTPYKDVNLRYLKRLKSIGGGLVGYSGHERGISVPIAAVALGAKIIEKHFTIDKNMEGSDHKVSLLPHEFKLMVDQIRQVEQSLGSDSVREISQGEKLNRDTLAKSIVANTSLQKGQVIQREHLSITSPGHGLQPNYMDALVGRRANRIISAGDYFYDSDLSNHVVEPRNYKFSRPFGIPVRYHDYSKLAFVSNLDFVEFHLSYSDLSLNPKDFISDPQEMGYAVHAPELFEGDHLLNLASADPDYLRVSIESMNKVCRHAIELKKLFPNTPSPVLVVNAGGFSEDRFLEEGERESMYDRVAKSFAEIDSTGVTIAIQTMPPFPWHFGGQRYHNLFVDPDEIASFCERTGLGVCFDVSHSMMACNYYGWDLSEFLGRIAPHVVHMHIVDAKGVDGEGVQIGKGDVDFNRLSKDLNDLCPRVQFIPEIWQGHKNRGEGFWHGLHFLESALESH